MSNFVWMTLALVIGGAIAYVAARRVAMTDMPQMVAIYNGMGGGAAALIAAVEFMKPETMPTSFAVLGIIGALIGSVSFSGSMIAFAKLQGIIKKSFLFPGQNVLNLLVLAGAVVLAVIVALQHTGNMGGSESLVLIAFFALSLLYGVLMTLPIGGADMPVVISLYNALTGLAVGLEGYVLGNGALIIAGIVVGAAGTLLTQMMAKAMNRSIGNVLFAGFGAKGGQELESIEGSMKESSPDDAAVTLAFAPEGHHRARLRHGRRPGAAQGLGAGQAARRPRHPGEVRHPPGRRPHARAHERAARRGRRALRHDLRPGRDQRRVPDRRRRHRHRRQRRREPGRPRRPRQPHLRHADPGRGQGASRRSSIKRGRGAGFAGIENKLFYADNTRMVYGDAQDVAGKLIAGVKKV